MSENQTRQTLHRQNRNLALFAALVALLLSGYVYFTYDSAEVVQPAQAGNFDLPGDKNDPKEMWMAKFQGENQLLDQRMKYLEGLVLETQKSSTEKEYENQALQKEVTALRESLREIKTAQSEAPAETREYNPIQPLTQAEYPLRELKEVVSATKNEKVKSVDSCIPAGTTVKAILVSSVDVPCGLYTQSDPQPVKLQILDDGRLPHAVRVKLKGGIVIASAYGDLSSERVIIRTERLTQTRPSGDFVETELTGYITGHDGKYGVRGCLVDMSGKMVQNAAVSGFFSGVNQILQKTRDFTNISYNNPEQENVAAAGNVLKYGGLSGATNAFDRLTDYFIKQADRVSPVIQLSAGQPVDITITHGCDLGGLNKDKVSEVRTRNRRLACVK
jgi:conjugal transfer pilus assembly protein TraB